MKAENGSIRINGTDPSINVNIYGLGAAGDWAILPEFTVNAFYAENGLVTADGETWTEDMVNLTYAGFANLVYDISKKLSDDGKLFQVHFTKQGDSPLKDFASTGNQQGAADSLWYKDHGTKDMIDVMVRTMNGERVFPESSPNVTLKDIFSEDLTPKQMKILRYFVKGYTYEEIAQELDMTKRNVRWHLDNIVEKSGYENKYELLIALIDSKLIVANLTDEE